MNKIQFEQSLERFANALLEVLDADGSQCDAWDRKGHDLIHAFAVAEFTNPPKPEIGAPRVIRQCSAPRLDLPSSRDADEPADWEQGGVHCASCGALDHARDACPYVRRPEDRPADQCLDPFPASRVGATGPDSMNCARCRYVLAYVGPDHLHMRYAHTTKTYR